MKRSRSATVPAIVALVCTALTATRAGAQAARAWLDPSRSPEQRAADVVAQLTLDEKLTELHGIQNADHQRCVPGIDRLGIPPLVSTNGPAGVGPGDARQQIPATALPAPVSLAATFDTSLARQYGVITGAETRDLGESLLEGPDVNIGRVPLNGRNLRGIR
jgi:beta-glucosidase